MLDLIITQAKRCCAKEHARLVRRLGACAKESKNATERHHCYRRAAKMSGVAAKNCMAEGNH